MICPNYNDKEVKNKFNDIVQKFGGQPLSDAEFRDTDLRNQREGQDYKSMNLAYYTWDMYNGEIENIPDSREEIEDAIVENEQQGETTEQRDSVERSIDNVELFNILDKLRDKTGIDYTIDKNLENLGEFKNGKVHINPDKAKGDTPFHEFSHGFISAVKEKNPELYNNLKNEILEGEGRTEYNRISRQYSDKTEEDIVEETIVSLIGQYSYRQYSEKRGSNLWDWIHELIAKIKAFIRQSINSPNINTTKLNPNTTLSEIASFMTSKQSVMVDGYRVDKRYEQQHSVEDLGDSVENQIKSNNYNATQENAVRETIKKVKSIHESAPLDQNTNKYEHQKKSLERATEVLNSEFPDDIFIGEEKQEYENARIRGNQIDDMVQYAVENKDSSTDIRNTKEFNEIREFLVSKTQERGEKLLFDGDGLQSAFTKVKQHIYDIAGNRVVMTQNQLFNLEKGTGGTTDLFVVNKNGSLDIIDTKTSRQPFTRAYKVVNRGEHSEIVESNEEGYEESNAVIRSYNNSFYVAENPDLIQKKIDELNERLTNATEEQKQLIQPQIDSLKERKQIAVEDKKNETRNHLVTSKRDRHARQLALYKSLANSKGLKVRRTSIMGVHLDRMNNNLVTGVKSIDEITVNPTQEVAEKLDKYKTDNEDEVFTNYVDIYDENYSKWINSAIDLLYQRMHNIKKEGVDDTAAEEADLSRQLNTLETLRRAEAFSTFIHETRQRFVGKNGFIDRMDAVVDRIGDENLSQQEYQTIIRDLSILNREVMPYREVIDEIKEDLNYYSVDEIDADSPHHTVFKISEALDRIESQYKKAAKDILPERLAQFGNKEVNEQISDYKKKELEKKDNLIEIRQKAINEGKSIEHNKKQIAKLEREKEKIRGKFFKIDAEDLRRAFQGDEMMDIQFIDMLLTPHGSNPNPILGSLAIMVKNKQANANQRVIDKSRQLAKKYKNFVEKINRSEDNVAELNKELYERISTVNYNKINLFDPEQDSNDFIDNDQMAFVQKADIKSFNSDLINAVESAKVKAVNASSTKSGEMVDEAKYRSTVIREMDDFYRRTLKGKDNFLQEIERQRDNLGVDSENFHHWVAERFYDKDLYKNLKGDPDINKSEYGRLLYEKFIKDKNADEVEKKIAYLKGMSNDLLEINDNIYHNERWDVIQNNSTLKEYYDTLTQQHFDLQAEIPQNARRGYILPSVPKIPYDRFSENKRSYIEYNANEFYKSQSEDIEELGSKVTDDTKLIPIHHTQNMNADDVSLDLFSSMVRFMQSVEKYKANAEIKQESDLLLNVIQDLGIQERDNQTLKQLKRSYSKNSGDKKIPASNLISAVEDFIDNNIYGQTKNPWWIKGVRADKIVDNLMSLASMSMIGGDLLVGVGNWIMGRTMNLHESIVNEYFSMSNRTKAQKYYANYLSEGGFMKDYGKSFPETFVGKLAEKYDAVQGTFKDEFGRKVTGSVAKKMRSMSTWFALMSNGEFQVQTEGLMAHLDANKAVNKETGEEKSIIDLYNEEFANSGEIKLPEGWEFKGTPSDDGTIDLDIMNKAHALNERLHGVYNDFSRPKIEKEAVGRLATMYRRFLVPATKRRFKEAGPDYLQQNITEGFYRTFYRLMREDIMRMYRQLRSGTKEEGPSNIGTVFSKKSSKKSRLDSWEKANLKRSLAELSQLALLAGSLSLLSNWADADDDEEPSKAYYYTAYWLKRLKTELQMYIDPRATLKVFQSPTAMYNLSTKTARFLGQIAEDTATASIERYERDAGPAEKGDSKAFWYGAKLLGMGGENVHPEQALKILDMYD